MDGFRFSLVLSVLFVFLTWIPGCIGQDGDGKDFPTTGALRSVCTQADKGKSPWWTALIDPASGDDPCELHQNLFVQNINFSCCLGIANPVKNSKCMPCNKVTYNLAAACLACTNSSDAKPPDRNDLKNLALPIDASTQLPRFSDWQKINVDNEASIDGLLPDLPWLNTQPLRDVFNARAAVRAAVVGGNSSDAPPDASGGQDPNPPASTDQAPTSSTTNQAPPLSTIDQAPPPSATDQPGTAEVPPPASTGINAPLPTSTANSLPTGASISNTSPPSSGSSPGPSPAAIVGGIVGAVVIFGLLFIGLILLRRRLRARRAPSAEFLAVSAPAPYMFHSRDFNSPPPFSRQNWRDSLAEKANTIAQAPRDRDNGLFSRENEP